MTENQKMSVKTKKRFAKGFFWGKVEHMLESYTTFSLLIGFLLHIIAILNKKWILTIVAGGFFFVSLIFRVGAGAAHKLEKHYMDILRFGRWKKKLEKK